MTVIGVGDLKMADGAQFPGMIIKAAREELQEIAGSVLYREVWVTARSSTTVNVKLTCKDVFGEVFGGLTERLIDVDRRVRAEKKTRKYSRDEVLALLDEIDPGEGRGEVKE